jgi:Skp family chaperone for outer membrane proteins
MKSDINSGSNAKLYVARVAIIAILAWAGCCMFCCNKATKVAVVDVQQIVANAQPVVQLRQEMQDKVSNLQQWIDNSNASINKEESQEKKDELAQQYQAELLQRQQVIQQDYALKLQQIDSALTKLIEEVAAKEGFSITFVKGSVAAGGTDITDKVIAKLQK